MKDKDIEYIKMIAKTGNLTKAAEQLYISQPSLTQYLHRLENSYGVMFFHRTKKGLDLTDSGRRFIEMSEKMIDGFEKMKNALGILSESAMKVDVGITSFLGSFYTARFMKRFKALFPNGVLNLVEASSLKLEDLVSAEKVDFAILHTPVQDSRLMLYPMSTERILLAVSINDEDYLLSRKAQNHDIPVITREIMLKKKYAMLLSSQRNRQIADRILAMAGVAPKISMTTTTLISAMSLTENDLGASFVPESYAKRFGGLYKLHYFSFPPNWNAEWSLCAAFLKSKLLSDNVYDVVDIFHDCITDKEVYLS